jgi:hypothetical protein
MPLTVRTTRTLKATDIKFTPEQIQQLARLSLDPGYQTLLDLMESACISIDTAMVNASPGQPEEVLGAHAVSRAAWLFFTYVQKQVVYAYNSRAGDSEEPAPSPSIEDILQGVN